MGLMNKVRKAFGIPPKNGINDAPQQAELLLPEPEAPKQSTESSPTKKVAARRVKPRRRDRQKTQRYVLTKADGSKKVIEHPVDEITGVHSLEAEADAEVDLAFQTLNDCLLTVSEDVQAFSEEIEEKTANGSQTPQDFAE